MVRYEATIKNAEDAIFVVYTVYADTSELARKTVQEYLDRSPNKSLHISKIVCVLSNTVTPI